MFSRHDDLAGFLFFDPMRGTTGRSRWELRLLRESRGVSVWIPARKTSPSALLPRGDKGLAKSQSGSCWYLRCCFASKERVSPRKIIGL